MENMEIRQEDLGKMMLRNAEVLDIEVSKEVFTKFFQATQNRMYLLFAKDIGYFTILKNNSMLAKDSTDKFIEFLDESTFFIADKDEKGKEVLSLHKMNEIIDIEYNEKIEAVELWLGQGNPRYFQLMPYDESTVHI